MLPERESQAEAWWHPVSARLFFGFLLIKVSVNRDWAAKRSRDVSVTRPDKGKLPQSLRDTLKMPFHLGCFDFKTALKLTL